MVTFFITSTMMILTVLFIRFLLKNKVSFLVLYPLWGIVLLRLLVPFTPLESPISVMNLVERAGKSIESVVQGEKTGRQENIKDSTKDEAKGDILPEKIAEEKFQAEQEKEDSAWVQNEPTGENAVKEKASKGETAKKEEIGGASGAAGQKEKDFTGKFHQNTPVDMKKIGMVLWISGSLLFLASLLLSNILFYRRLYRDRKLVDCRDILTAPGIREKQEHKQTYGRKMPVYVTKQVRTPCLAGVLHPAIYLTPEAYKDKEHLRQVLLHEQMHASHRDYIWALFRSLCLVIYWFDPFVWIAAIYARQDAEIACDEAVLRNCTDTQRYDYGKMLIRMSQTKRQDRFCLITSMGNEKWNLKERITMLTKKRKRSLWQAAAMLVLAGVLVGCGMTRDKQNTGSEVEEIKNVNTKKQDAGQQADRVKKQETATGAALSEEQTGESEISFTTHGSENEFFNDTLTMLNTCTKETFDRVGPTSETSSTTQGPVRVTCIDHFLDDDSLLYFVNAGYTMRSFVLRRGEKYDAYILDGSRWGKKARTNDLLSSAQPPDLLTPGGYFKLCRADYDKDGDTEVAFHICENPDTFVNYEVLYMFDNNGSDSYELYTCTKEDFKQTLERFCRQYDGFDEKYPEEELQAGEKKREYTFPEKIYYTYSVETGVEKADAYVNASESEVGTGGEKADAYVPESKKNKVSGSLKDYDYIYFLWQGEKDYIKYEFGHEAGYDIVLEDDKKEISVKIGILRFYHNYSKGLIKGDKADIGYIQIRSVLEYQGNGNFVMGKEEITKEEK